MPGYCAANLDDWRSLEKVVGWITRNEAAFLQSLVTSLAPGATVIELGCYLGRSSLVIASALPPGCVVYCIDTFRTDPALLAEFCANTKDLRTIGNLRFLPSDTVEAAATLEEKSVQMLYINANHTHRQAVEEIAAWHKKMAPGGLLVCHDRLAIAQAIGVNPLHGAYSGAAIRPETIIPCEVMP